MSGENTSPSPGPLPSGSVEKFIHPGLLLSCVQRGYRSPVGIMETLLEAIRYLINLFVLKVFQLH